MKLFALIVFLLPTQMVGATTGQYDTSFGDQGVTLVNINPAIDAIEVAWDVAQGPDNKYYLASEAITGDDPYMVLSRFNEDGTLDSSFDFDGHSTVNYNIFSSAGFESPRSIYIQDNNKIFMLGGASTENGSQMVLSRFLPDGSLDNSFAGNGMLIIPFSGNPDDNERGFDLKLDDNGFIYIAGTSEKPTVVKLLPNGSFDNSFNLTGKKELDIQGYEGDATGIHVLNSGKIIVTGFVINTTVSSNFDFFAAKLNANGTLDTSFNAIGYKIIPIDLQPNQTDQALNSVVNDSGQIFIVGASINGESNNDNDMSVVKLNPDGGFDNTFGINGKVIVSVNSGENLSDVAYDAVLQSDHKLVLCGFSTNSMGELLPTIVRLLADGSRDFTFGEFGVLTLPGDPTNPTLSAQVSGCTLDLHNRIITSGAIDLNDTKATISRIDLGLDIIFIDGFE